MDFNEDSLRSGQYIETVRALHQTVVSLRSALEQSRSEILELKTKSWPLENLESAITALSLENHLLRKKILDLNRNEEPAAEDVPAQLESRFKFVASSLENLSTTKSHVKSSRTKSYQNISGLSDYEPVFTSTPRKFDGKPRVEINEIPIYLNTEPERFAEAKKDLDIIKQKEPEETSNYKYAIKEEITEAKEETINGIFEGTINDESINKPITEVSGAITENIKDITAHDNEEITKADTTRKDDTEDIKGNTWTSREPAKKLKSLDDIPRELSKENKSHLSTRDKRDKKISVSVNLEIYHKSSRKRLDFREPSEKMQQEKGDNILQHSSSTDLLDQEVDDIELIFTNEDTKETNLKEPLISIEGGSEQNIQCPAADFDQNVSADISDRELDDDVFNDNFENENQENSNFQSQTFDFTRENSQIYNSKSDNSINQDEVRSLKSYYSYHDSSFENKSLEKDESFDRFEERIRIVETDMSKVGIQDVEYSAGRRNTCPNPLQYRPIAHREAIGRGLNTRKTRPILAHSNAVRKESGAQTDISALPSKTSWRSESSLAHKVKIGDNFTTLPSKYPLPGSRLRLSEKTVEARRVLLSDIGFTSMVPELSRSADHLCPGNLKTPSVGNYGQFLKTTDLYSPGYTSQRFMWTNASPSESHSQSRYSSLYPLPSPPAPSRRCSAPVSPCRRTVIKHVPSKVRFANGSLPELRGDWNSANDSGDSTDSLVEEAEQYLRRSIDCIVGGKDIAHYSTTKSSLRRASAPEPARDNIPPQGWQPFLPRLPRDLRLDYWVKVISPEGRVRGGRVRYIGHLLSQSEQFVGVQLSMPDGHSDGTYNNRRYFQCEPYHGIFVPFKKVIMGWKP